MAMGVAIPLQVSCSAAGSHISYEGVSGGDSGPSVNLALSLKLPIHQLVNALAEFQRACERQEQDREAKLKEVSAGAPMTPAAMPPGLSFAVQGASTAGGTPLAPAANLTMGSPMPTPPPPPPVKEVPTATVASKAASSPDAGAGLSATASATELPRAQLSHVTWDDCISALQPGHEAYVKRTKWKPEQARVQPSWRLVNETCLVDFKATALEPPPQKLQRKRPEAVRNVPESMSDEGTADLPDPTPGSGSAGASRQEAAGMQQEAEADKDPTAKPLPASEPDEEAQTSSHGSSPQPGALPSSLNAPPGLAAHPTGASTAPVSKTPPQSTPPGSTQSSVPRTTQPGSGAKSQNKDCKQQ
mmetsp:Transcript_12698/g.28066  ORF Transcript_12698/g.28066 Transcript_12698/m.28066 type:complete len:359 (-) Transcript_12698:85-1161(-)